MYVGTIDGLVGGVFHLVGGPGGVVRAAEARRWARVSVSIVRNPDGVTAL